MLTRLALIALLALAACAPVTHNMNPHPPTGQSHARSQHYPQGQ